MVIARCGSARVFKRQNHMDRAALLSRLPPPGDPAIEWPLRHALVQCLSPEEACRAIDLKFEQPYFDRRRLLNRISVDISAGLETCHVTLIDGLFEAYPSLPHRRQQSCASTLSWLLAGHPELGRRRLLHLLLSSPYVTIRRQACRALRTSWEPDCAASVLVAWSTHRDQEAFELLASRMPLDWLRDQVCEVFIPGVRGRILSRVAIRLAPSDPGILDRLYDVAPVAYAYAAAKLKAQPDRVRLRAAFDAAETADDRSLVIWCIGQLRDWDLLLELHRRPAPTLEEILAWARHVP